MAAALVLLGTWPVVLAVLERRGRLLQHTYLDYSITNFLAAVLIALTFGQIGGDTPERNFLTQLTQPQDYWPSIMFALAGGVVITLGTVATHDLTGHRRAFGHRGHGLKSQGRRYKDLMAAGIIDPTKVVRCCLEHAASVAKTFITSDAVVVDIRVPKCTPVVNPMCGSGYGF
ncbi:hypothetical protein ZWY2020_049124 [Hordeum vulgare]|nr:hypothetical protein ZWY2020_049124 [Hordeum vulgare]